MIRKYFLPVLSFAGLLFGVFVVLYGNKPVPSAQPAAPPPTSAFSDRVAGRGMIEAATRNIEVAANVPGVVTNVLVHVGQHVAAGTPLFTLDDRTLRATIAGQQAALKQAKEKLVRLQSAPRPEELPPAEALVHEADANFADAKSLLDAAESLGDSRAISREELMRRRFAFQAADSKLRNAQATLALLKAGTWKPDIEVAKADVDYATAQVQATQTAIDLLTVKAPVEGDVLQVNVRIGEFAQAGPLASPLMIFGDVSKLHVRVDIDENEAWRVQAGADATASMRGKPDPKIPLHFEYIEPFVVPKKSLSGDSAERVDTRVLQVIYSFDRKNLPVYVGQQMDVYLNASAADAGSATTRRIGA